MTECPICSRDIVEAGKMCRYHHQALKNLQTAFADWKKALDLEWSEYLMHVKEAEGLGSWVREVIQYITSGDVSSEHL